MSGCRVETLWLKIRFIVPATHMERALNPQNNYLCARMLYTVYYAYKLVSETESSNEKKETETNLN